MGDCAIRLEKLLVLTFAVICKVAGIAIILLYTREKITALLPIGALTFFISSFGCAGTFFESRRLLLTYSGLLMIFLLSKTILIVYYVVGLISPIHKTAHLPMKILSFSTAEFIILYITALLEMAAAVLSFRLARRLLKASNVYENLQNEDGDTTSIQFNTTEITEGVM